MKHRECWPQRKMLQQEAASSQLAALIGTTVNQEVPWRLVLDLRGRTWPGAVDPPHPQNKSSSSSNNRPSSGWESRLCAEGGRENWGNKGKEGTDGPKGSWNKGEKGIVATLVSVAQEKKKALPWALKWKERERSKQLTASKRRKWEMRCFL